MVIGLGQFGEHVAGTLAEAGQEVVAIDKDMERIEAFKERVPRVARANCTSEEAMRSMGAAEVSVAIIALGEEDFESAVLGTSVLKSLGVSNIVVRSSSRQRGRILALAGAARVVYPEAEMGENLGRLLLHESLKASVELPSGFSLSELTVPKLISGKTLADLQLRQTHRLNVIAIGRKGLWTEATPQAVLEEGDLLLIAGRSEQVAGLAALWD